MDYTDKANRYVSDVLGGKIPACKWVRLACQRHRDDLEQAKSGRKYRFDRAKANRICEFIESLPHVKGRWPSTTIQLQDWQCFIWCSVFGWVDEAGNRRCRTMFLLVPRKNSKTTMCAGTGLYMLSADGEQGSEVYSCAVAKDQARYCFDIAKRMAHKTPDLCEALGVEPWKHSIAVEHSGSKFIPLASDADSLEGLNVHCGIIDELHAHKTRDVFDVIDDATGSRTQPLKFIISTAGSNLEGVCFEQQKYLEGILEGRLEDESYFGLIYTIDPEDDWTQPEAWVKANPNYGVSVDPENLKTQALQAIAIPGKQNDFKTKRLNLWVSAGTAYFHMLAWDNKCRADIVEAEYGQYPCWFGLDLASKIDLAAFIRLYKAPDHWAVFGDYYLPEDALEKGRPNADIYTLWARQGLITATPGATTDYEFIKRDVDEWAHRVKLQEACYDPWQAALFVSQLTAMGLPMVEIPMNVKNISEPMKTMGAMILDGNLRHDGNPVFSWMLGNVMAKGDAKGNVYPTKERDAAKIDGPVAVMATMVRALPTEDTSSLSSYAQAEMVV